MDRDQLETFVRNLADPVTKETIGQKGLLKNVTICDGQAKVTLIRPPVSHGLQEQFKEAVRQTVASQQGIHRPARSLGLELRPFGVGALRDPQRPLDVP